MCTQETIRVFGLSGIHTFDRETFLKMKYWSTIWFWFTWQFVFFFFFLLNKSFYKMANRLILELALFVYDEPFWCLPSPPFLVWSLDSVVTTVTSHKEGFRFKSPWGFSVWSLQILPVSAPVLHPMVILSKQPN